MSYSLNRYKLLLAAVTVSLFAIFFALAPVAHAANPTTLSFQGKVVNSGATAGTNVTDGTYTFVFKLYTVSSGGAALWTETDSSVTVTAGVFQVNLGAVCPFFVANACNSSTPIDFNANPALYLGITFNADPAGEMTPRVQLQSVPYAFNSDKVGGFSASQLVQLSPGSQQTGNVNVSGSGTFGTSVISPSLTTSGALVINSGAANNITIDSAGAGTAAINIGGTNATSVNIGRTNQTTTVAGTLAANNYTTTGTTGFKFQPAADSGNTFQVQNTAGTDILNASTSAVLQLIQNNSFETNINGWVAKGSGTIAQSDTSAEFGKRALQIVTGTTIGNGASYSVPLKASTQYSLSLWAMRPAGSAAAFNISFQENGADNDAKCLTNQTITNVWAEYHCTFTTGATVNTTTNVYVKQTDAVTDTILVDGVSLVQSATAATYDAGGQNIDISTADAQLVFNGANSGELAPWSQSSNSLSGNREDAATVNANGYMYVIGGYDGTTVQTSVLYAKINADGSTGTWNSTTVLPGARRYLEATVANGYLYAVGGFDGATADATVYYAKLNGDGTIGAWQTNAQPLPGARVGPSIVNADGYLYVLGGCSDNTTTCGTPNNSIYYAKLTADGSTGKWTTNTNNLTLARGFGSAAVVNGYIYYIGGYNAAAQTTVYAGQIQSDASVAAFAPSTSLPQARREQTSVVANGYLYAIGGFDGTTQVSTVYYSKIFPNGTTSSWTAEANALPANRAAPTTTIVNGYVYALGGFDGTNRTATVFYASTPRLLVGGSIDLVGLTGQTLSDSGGGGSLAAGNTSIIGTLKVDGYADFNNGISVDSALNLNAVSATPGQNVFNINNSSSNSIFNVKHLGSNFGAVATTGAFVDRNSYWGDEFNLNRTGACTGTATRNSFGARGDIGGALSTACAAGATNAGEISFSGVAAAGAPTMAACSSNITCGGSAVSGNYGQERISVTGVITAASTVASLEYIGLNSAATISPMWAGNNLPVFTAKVKPSLVASGSNARFEVGLGDKAVATGAFPTNGIFFSNCTASATCNGTVWNGVVVAAGVVVGTVSCTAGTETGTINTANFNYLRIEVRATNDIHFFVDTNTATGINEIECGSGVSGAGPTAAGLTLMLESAFMTNTVTTENLDVDFVRVWQDDPAGSSLAVDSMTPATAATTTDSSLLASLSQAADPSATPTLDSSAATSGNDLVTSHTNDPAPIASSTPLTTQPTTNGTTQLADSSGVSHFSFDTGGNATLAGNLNLNNAVLSGGMSIGGDLSVGGLSTFQKLATFLGRTIFRQDVQFDGHLIVAKDSAGYASIKTGESTVHVSFTTAYDNTPVVSASVTNGQFAVSTINTVSDQGFDISLQAPATADTTFSWTAIGVINPQTASNPPPASTPTSSN